MKCNGSLKVNVLDAETRAELERLSALVTQRIQILNAVVDVTQEKLDSMDYMEHIDNDIDDMQRIIEGKCPHCDSNETTHESLHSNRCPTYRAWLKWMNDKQQWRRMWTTT